MGRVDAAQPPVRVLHEEAPNLSVAVADALRRRLAGRQQQAGVLDAAAGEHVNLGCNLALAAVAIADFHLVQATAAGVRQQLGGGGVNDHRCFPPMQNVPCPPAAETLLQGVEAPAADGEAMRIQAKALRAVRPRWLLLRQGAYPQVPLGAFVALRQVRLADRPAAVAHPVAPLEIDCVQARAATAPDVGGAAEES